MVKKGLGNGVEALFGEMKPQLDEQPAGEKVLLLPLSAVTPNPKQPRRSFDQGKLKELTASIKEQGVLQPILVRPISGEHNKYEIVAGERRYRAAEQAGLKNIPAIVKPLEDKVTLEVALIENIQRQELNPLEEAASFRDLLDNYGYTQAALAERLGKSRVYIANTLRLLALPESVRRYVTAGRLSAGHGKALLMLEKDDDRVALAERIIEEGLSVRETEELAKNPAAIYKKQPSAKSHDGQAGAKAPSQEDLLLNAIGERLRERLQTKVNVKKTGKQRGRITLEYYSDEELERLLELLLPGVQF